MTLDFADKMIATGTAATVGSTVLAHQPTIDVLLQRGGYVVAILTGLATLVYTVIKIVHALKGKK